MKNVSKGQGLVEFALVLPILLFLILTVLWGGVILLADVYQADMAASNAAREAATYVIDGTGSCYDKAMAAFGNPRFIGVVSYTQSITNCPADATKLPSIGVPIVATWVLTEDLPVPFFAGSPFPITRHSTDWYSR